MHILSASFASLAISFAICASTSATPLDAGNSASLSPAYVNNCDGSSMCSARALDSGCVTALNMIDRNWTYYYGARFVVGHCYISYETDRATGSPSISGQALRNAAEEILRRCPNRCGNYGTDNVGCPTCHVMVAYSV